MNITKMFYILIRHLIYSYHQYFLKKVSFQ